MKKYISYFVILLILVVICNYLSYRRYAYEVNSVTSEIIENVLSKYPEVNSEDLIKIISSSKRRNESNTLKKYGFMESDISYIKSLDYVYYKNLIINISVFGIFGLICGIGYYLRKRKYKKNIEDITNYLKRINEGIYDLEIIDNVEGNLSILKNEVYTTMVCLKEMYAREYNDKIKLKDNLANISHQLKTPLTGIMLMIDTLLEENVSKEKRQEYLQDIRKQIENINFLIYAMLKLSRFDAGVVKFDSNKIVVKELVFYVLKNVDILRELKNVNIHVKGKSDVIFVGDYKWECEAITNIVKNAIEYSHENSDVYVNYIDNGIYVSLEIVNYGEKISKEDMHHIFDRFYKKNNDENNFGIGLSLAKEIIEKDNGSIRVESKNNKTIFKVKYYK